MVSSIPARAFLWDSLSECRRSAWHDRPAKSMSCGVLAVDARTCVVIVQGRRIVIKRSSDVKDLKSCAVLFIARSEKTRLRKIFDEIGRQPVLTVSEIEGFARHWGIINFTTDGNRVRFEINTQAAKRSHLRVSSRLLRVARVVDDLHQKQSENSLNIETKTENMATGNRSAVFSDHFSATVRP